MNNSFHYLRHSDENQYEDRPLVAGANACNHSSRNMEAKKNQPKYCTLPAAQSLIERGIVLETERYWVWDECITTEPRVESKISASHWDKAIPAPSPAEVLRELPDNSGEMITLMRKFYGDNVSPEFLFRRLFDIVHNIDLAVNFLIFVMDQKGKEKV